MRVKNFYKLFVFLSILTFISTTTIFAQKLLPRRDIISKGDAPNIINDQSRLHSNNNTEADSNVTLIGRWPDGPCYTTFVVGNYAYICNGGAMDILDISSPNTPVRVGWVITPSVVRGIYISGNYAYVADGFDGGLRIIDISNPSNPTEAGFYDTEDYAYGVYVSGNYAYVADRDDGLRIIEISSPSHPPEVGFYDTGDLARGVYVSGNYAYVADSFDGLRIIDISNPSNPIEAGFYDTEGNAFGVYVSGNYAYVADGSDGLRIIDISNPSNPAEAGFYDTGGYALGVYVSGNYAYVADGFDGMYILRNDLIAGVEKENNIPKDFELFQNYPNPFNPSTLIKYAISSRQYATLKVYDVLGKEVATLVNEVLPAGDYEVEFSAISGSAFGGNAYTLPSGIYFYKLQAGNFAETKKMILIK